MRSWSRFASLSTTPRSAFEWTCQAPSRHSGASNVCLPAQGGAFRAGIVASRRLKTGTSRMRSDSPNTFEPDVDTLKELATAHAGAAAEAAAERPDLLDALAERANDMLCAGCEHQADYLNGIVKDAERIKRERAKRHPAVRRAAAHQPQQPMAAAGIER